MEQAGAALPDQAARGFVFCLYRLGFPEQRVLEIRHGSLVAFPDGPAHAL